MSEVTSQVSLPITIVNVPEPASISGHFVYNFYMKNEDISYQRTPTSPFSARSSFVNQQTVADIEANERGSIRTRVPRYIKLKIEPSLAAGIESLGWGETFDSHAGPLRSANQGTLHELLVVNKLYNIEGKIENDYIASCIIQDKKAKARNTTMVYRISTAKGSNGSP